VEVGVRTPMVTVPHTEMQAERHTETGTEPESGAGREVVRTCCTL
jgi:hypothetical protein